MGKRMLALGAAVLLSATLAAPASGVMKIYESTTDQARVVGKIKKGKCRVKREGNLRYFRASATSTNGDYELSVVIDDEWKGYGTEYEFTRGETKPGRFYVRGPGGPYSSLFAPPGTDGLPAGGVAFNGRGSKMSAGFLPTPNVNFKRGVVLAGIMNCR